MLITEKGRMHLGKKEELEAFYGLPTEVKFCKSCVISNQRPNSAIEFQHTANTKKNTIHLSNEGVCDACVMAKKKSTEIDWTQREKELLALCNKFRRHDGQYDCIVSGSGGKDSFYTSHILKYKYGMNPLTVTWAPHIYTAWGWENFQSWIHAGFDNVLMTPNGRAHRLLTRLAVDNLFHPFQPFIFGQKSLAPKMAALYKIPLVFYGENEAEYGNPIGDNSSSCRDWSYFSAEDFDHVFLSGAPISQLLKDYGMTKHDLKPYMPANPEDLEKLNLEVHYLGYYLKWHPQSAYYYSVDHGGFKPSPERTPGTYSKYNSIDDKIDDFHYYTTFIKFGIGRATYDAAQEIRNEDINREEGVALVKKYDGEFPERFSDEIFKYLTIGQAEFPKAYNLFEHPVMNKDYFMYLTDKFRSPHLWEKKNNQWLLRHTVY